MNFPIAYARGCDPNSKVENAMVEKNIVAGVAAIFSKKNHH
jgi:hypothetical protein